MLISIDGPVGAGKTTLTSELALKFGGIGLWYSDVAIRTEDTKKYSLVNVIGHMKQELRDFFREHDLSPDTHTFFLFNLMRLCLSQTFVSETSKPVFIDVFWDPLWVLESEHYPKFFGIFCEFMPVPDISFFLKIDEERALLRAQQRDANADVTHTLQGLKKKRDDFLKWGGANIPNFQRLYVDRPLIDVVENASEIIEKTINLKASVPTQAPPVKENKASPQREFQKQRISWDPWGH